MKSKFACYFFVLGLYGCGGNSPEQPDTQDPTRPDPPETEEQPDLPPVNACMTFGEPKALTELENVINEASGLAASRTYTDVVYTHADSGGYPTVYAYNTNGQLLANFTLEGVSPIDWEDIAAGPGPGKEPYIYVADIGDNAARMGAVGRDEVLVYRFPEPDISELDTPATISITEFDTFRFQYPDIAHDAETLAVNPVDGEILLFTKENDGTSIVFRALPATPIESITPLEKIAHIITGPSDANGQVTAGDISPNGDRVILRTYTSILMWQVQTPFAATFETEATVLDSPVERQSEGLTFSYDGNAWYSIGEQSATLFAAQATCN